MIIDCHGHYTTAPKRACRRSATRRSRRSRTRRRRRRSTAIRISDDEIRESLEDAQLKLQRERGTDLTIFSPRASAMAHHIGNEAISLQWTRACNDLIARVVRALSGELRRRLPAAAIARRPARQQRRRARALRQRAGLHRLQPQPRSVGRLLERPAADRPPLVSALREDGRARRAGDGARQLGVQSRTSTPPARTTSTPTRRRSCSSSRPTCSKTSRRCGSSSRTAAARSRITGDATAGSRRT